MRARLKWKTKGDAMTLEFFKAVQDKPPRTTIGELRSPSGASITLQHDIEEACVAFYKELYTSPERGERTRPEEQEILESLSNRISPLTASALAKPLSEAELHRAACALAKEKAPGPDGLPMDFFTLFWPLIGDDFF